MWFLTLAKLCIPEINLSILGINPTWSWHMILFFKKYLLNLLQHCFCFMFWFFDCEACGIFSSPTRDWTHTPALKGDALTTGMPGKSLILLMYFWIWFANILLRFFFFCHHVHWEYCFCSPLPFAYLLFSTIDKTSSDNYFAFLHFFFLGMVLITAFCTMLWTSIHSSLGTLSNLTPWIYLSLPL